MYFNNIMYIYDFNKNLLNNEGVSKKLMVQFSSLFKLDTSKRHAQNCVRKITEMIINYYKDQINYKELILIPVLRAGLPMWEQANQQFDYPKSNFIFCNKKKGTNKVNMFWADPKPQLYDSDTIILLDTIIATGDTMNFIIKNIRDDVSYKNQKIIIISCYASPRGMNKVLQEMCEKDYLLVGAKSLSVDKSGYLIPLTNGDMGDKLYVGRV